MNKVLKRGISLLVIVAILIITIIVHILYPTRVRATQSLNEQDYTDVVDLIKNEHPSESPTSHDLTPTEMSVTLTTTPKHTPLEGVHQKEISKHGFILALQYLDQITGGTMNLLSLQCWAKSVTPPGREYSVRVVEPFIQQGSRFGVSLMSKKRFQTENDILLRDLFDYLRWTAYTINKKYADLISWNKFLSSSPKQIIMVYSTCTNCSCLSDNNLSSSKQVFLQDHNFKVVRTVCYHVGPVYEHKANEFRDLVYGPFSPTDVTVVFDTWGGIIDQRNTLKRLILSDLPQCVRSINDGLMTPSAKVVADSEAYVKQYIHKSTDDRNSTSDVYIAVMFRMEYYAILLQRKGTSKYSQYKSMLRCIDNIASRVNHLKRTHRTQSVFLAMDYGKFGSVSFGRLLEQENGKIILTKDEVDTASKRLYTMLFGNSSSLRDWEESFDRVASVKSPGYVAMMQKTLASRATCLVLVGGGSFQKTTQVMFTSFNNISSCIYNLCGKFY